VRVVEKISDCRAALEGDRREGRRIGYVPTMGFLHQGHMTLVDRARVEADVVVVSIFVNPTQFGPREDYARYPRDLPRDVAMCEERGVDLVFAPSVDEMFPDPTFTRVTMRILTERYEGEARPGHFDGVLTVVAKLFHIVEPDVAVFGQKDAQQAAVVRRMVQDLAFRTEIVVAPTVREEDGLAASSRNAFLSEADRTEARALSRAVLRAAELAEAGERDVARIEEAMRGELAGSPALEVEYAAVVDPARFTPVERLDGAAVAVVAARVGGTRLIDNAPLTSDG